MDFFNLAYLSAAPRHNNITSPLADALVRPVSLITTWNRIGPDVSTSTWISKLPPSWSVTLSSPLPGLDRVEIYFATVAPRATASTTCTLLMLYQQVVCFVVQ